MKAKYPVAAVFVLVALFSAPSRAGGQAKPNILLFISDDHGFSDYGFMGSEDVETPNLDRLAEAGLVYSRGYATPSCASSLAVLLTGDYPHRNGITGNDLKGRIGSVSRVMASHPSRDGMTGAGRCPVGGWDHRRRGLRPRRGFGRALMAGLRSTP